MARQISPKCSKCKIGGLCKILAIGGDSHWKVLLSLKTSQQLCIVLMRARPICVIRELS